MTTDPATLRDRIKRASDGDTSFESFFELDAPDLVGALNMARKGGTSEERTEKQRLIQAVIDLKIAQQTSEVGRDLRESLDGLKARISNFHKGVAAAAKDLREQTAELDKTRTELQNRLARSQRTTYLGVTAVILLFSLVTALLTVLLDRWLGPKLVVERGPSIAASVPEPAPSMRPTTPSAPQTSAPAAEGAEAPQMPPSSPSGELTETADTTIPDPSTDGQP